MERWREELEALVTAASQQDEADAAAERQQQAAADAERPRPGKQRRGQALQPRLESSADKAQSHLTDPALPILRTHTQGWEYGGHAPASGEAAGQIMVACAVTDAPHDKQQAEPLAQATRAILAQAGLERPQDEEGQAQAIPATLDTGYDREAAVQAREA